MDSTMSIVKSRSISKPPYFDGKNCTEWKKSMMIFMKSNDFNVWLVTKNGQKIPKKVINGEEIEKSEDELDDKDMKMMEQEAKAKHILCCALNPDDLLRVSSFHTAKEMWDELDKLREVSTPNVDSITVVSQEETPALATELNYPNFEFLEEPSMVLSLKILCTYKRY